MNRKNDTQVQYEQLHIQGEALDEMDKYIYLQQHIHTNKSIE